MVIGETGVSTGYVTGVVRVTHRDCWLRVRAGFGIHNLESVVLLSRVAMTGNGVPDRDVMATLAVKPASSRE